MGFAAVALLAVGFFVGLPWYVHTHTKPSAHPCVNNLMVIVGAKEQWALAKNKTTNDVPTWEDLRIYCGPGSEGAILTCPNGGTYTLGRVGESPTCSLGGDYHSVTH